MDQRLAGCRHWLFDLDNTLVDWRCRARAVRLGLGQETVQRFGALDDETWVEHFRQGHRLWWGRWLAGECSRDACRLERFRWALAQAGIADDAWAAYLDEQFRARMTAAIQPDGRVHALLAELQQAGRRLAVLTNGFADVQRAALARAGLPAYFEHIFISEEMGLHKPDRRAFLHVLETWGAPAGETVYLGDTWANDIEPAHALGLRTVWVNYKADPLPEANIADRIVASIAELAGESASW